MQVRRVNPLIARKKPGTTAEPSTESPAPSEATGDKDVEPSEESEDTQPTSSTTTEEPKGLNKLLAGRRRLAVRPTAAPSK